MLQEKILEMLFKFHEAHLINGIVFQDIIGDNYYAGWSDKYQQIFSRVNPVATPYFNFSYPEPTGVVSIISPKDSHLLGFISVIAPAIVGGNTVVVLAPEDNPLCAISFSEVLHSSDVPSGVINILSGLSNELIDQWMNGLIYE